MPVMLPNWKLSHPPTETRRQKLSGRAGRILEAEGVEYCWKNRLSRIGEEMTVMESVFCGQGRGRTVIAQGKCSYIM